MIFISFLIVNLTVKSTSEVLCCYLRVLTFTLVAGFALTVTGGAFTFIRSHSVDAVASGAETRHSLALVHI